MRKRTLWLGGTGVFALTLLVGCSNAITAITGNVTVICSTKANGVESSCTISKTPQSEQASAQNNCTNNGGSIVGSCPTSGLVGCCTQSQGQFSVEVCSYTGTESQVKTQCGANTFSTSP